MREPFLATGRTALASPVHRHLAKRTVQLGQRVAEFVNQGSPATNSALTGLARPRLTPDRALATINRLADQQAYILAANDVIYASALMLLLLLIPLVYLTRPAATGASGADVAAAAH